MKHPYMTVSFWVKPENHYWKDGTHVDSFVKKMDAFVQRLKGCPTNALLFKTLNENNGSKS